MALEMRMYDELTAVDPKIMLGLSTRQLGAVVLMAIAVGSTVAILWLTDNKDLLQVVPVLVALPIAVWGFTKPKGLKPEVFIRHVVRYYATPRRLNYTNDRIWRSQDRPTYEGKNVVSRKQARRVAESGH